MSWRALPRGRIICPVLGSTGPRSRCAEAAPDPGNDRAPSPLAPLAGAGIVLALALGACAHGTGTTKRGPPTDLAYTVSGDLERWEVELCFGDARPEALVGSESAALRLLEPRDVATGQALPVTRGDAPRLDLSGLQGPCLAYGVELSGGGSGWRQDLRRIGDDLLIANDLWLWHPPKVASAPTITVDFDFADARVSSPWRREGEARFLIPIVGLRWRSYTAVGQLDLDTFEVAGSELEVVVMGGERALTQGGIRRWMTSAGEAVASVPRLQVLIIPSYGYGSPVVFGLVERGGPAILLLVDSEAEDDEFIGEWVSIHELLHLGMPFIQRRDAWLPEGFVTYYTEVVRARTGLRSEERAWRALLSGFARGARDVRGDRSLEDASRSMHDLHAYSWVYWGGAAIALLSDVALREASDGSIALDDGLRHLWRCCATSPRRWTAEDILEELERWRGEAWIIPLCRRLLATSGFDDLPRLYRKLGVDMVHGDLALDGTAALTHLRSAIFAPTSTASHQ